MCKIAFCGKHEKVENMAVLFEKQEVMLRSTDMKIVRDFMRTVNWTAPLLCIRGARGVGKSTLLRQYIKQNFGETSRKALYCSLDWVYFAQHSILEVAEKFYQSGGKLLILDEVHKYPHWSREIKETAEMYPDIQFVLSGSSLLKIIDGDADLSRRCRAYDMPGLSFREYLQFYKGITLPLFSLEDVLDKTKDVAAAVNEVCRPLEHFHNYLKYGYYPFYLKNPIDYYALIEQTENYVIDVEIVQQRNVNPANCRKIKALINVLAQNVPYDTDITKLAQLAQLQRNTVLEYLNHLSDAKLINLIYSDLISVGKMQKPDKILLENPNMLYALATVPVHIGTARECFTVNQLSVAHTVEYAKEQGDFKVDGRYTFEIGGKSKTFRQIAGVKDSYVFSDDLEMPRGNKIPLWMLGVLY